MRNLSKKDQKPVKRRPPARSPEARENQMISLAMECAERQLEKGTASSQVITHFLKLGSIKEQKELLLLNEEISLKRAKTKAIEDSRDIKELYAQALTAMSRYSGSRGDDDD